MKPFLMSIFTVVSILFVSTVVAQKPVKVVISVPGAQDEFCKTRIENYLKREYGVVESNVNYHRHTATVKFLPDRTNIENIKTAIANAGYDADDVKANPDSYNMLPKDHRHAVPDTTKGKQ